MFFGGTHFSSFLAQNGTLWGVTFGPGLTSSASLATVSAIEKRPQKHKSPEPLEKKKRPDVAFIQGLILYSALTYIDSVPKSAIWGTPQKTTFS